jgi:MYXO-CTERM domain-containing protein
MTGQRSRSGPRPDPVSELISAAILLLALAGAAALRRTSKGT